MSQVTPVVPVNANIVPPPVVSYVVKKWDLNNASAGLPIWPGGFDRRMQVPGASEWPNRAARVLDRVPDAYGVVLHNPFGCFPTGPGGSMEMHLEQFSLASAIPALRNIVDLSRVTRAIADIRAMGMQVRVYLGAPKAAMSIQQFLIEIQIWAALRVPLYIDGNALPERAYLHRLMEMEATAMGVPSVGLEACPTPGSFLDDVKYPMFCNMIAWDGVERNNPGLLCHRGTALGIDGTLAHTIDECRKHEYDICMCLDGNNDASYRDIDSVGALIDAGGPIASA